MGVEGVLRAIELDTDRYVAELSEFLTIPSVSTLSEHDGDTRAAARWVLAQMERLGLSAQIFETARHPVVFAQSEPVADSPTLLVYGHYDVQPPDPLNEWRSPPFAPVVADGCIVARGATDDKGQFLTWLKALEAFRTTGTALPVNLKFIVEGEEEIGSPNLAGFLDRQAALLRADAVAVSDGSQFARGIPAITYGLRGLSYFQIDVTGPRTDLHSGVFGGVLRNPAQALAGILARLKNPDDTVAVPGFYDAVLPLEDWERKEMASLPVDLDALKAYLGIPEFVGEPGYSVIERKSARPTLDVNGVWGGFSGEGAKTVIPARAGAKVSMRLVPDQDPATVSRLFRQYVESLVPGGVAVTVTELHGAAPVLVSRKSPFVAAAERAIHAGFGKKPVFIREGGSIPVVNMLQKSLGFENILLLGWGSPDDGAHSPNERFCLADFARGIRSVASLLYELAGLRG